MAARLSDFRCGRYPRHNFENEAAHVFGSLSLDTEAIWAKLGTLHDLKNKLFDASLTEKAKQLFR